MTLKLTGHHYANCLILRKLFKFFLAYQFLSLFSPPYSKKSCNELLKFYAIYLNICTFFDYYFRYYRSGTEMVRMADTYLDEENYEKAYILYLKFLTLFIEKVREHPDFKTVSPTEKSHVMKKVKSVMPRSEELKKLLKAQYQNEYHDYQKMLEIQKKNEEAKAEKERQIQMKLEGEKIREAIYNYHDEKEKTLQKQRDFEVALWHQLKINQEEPSAPPLLPPSDFDESNIKNNLNIDRSTKPKIESTSSSAASIPVIPDRNTKPASLGLYSSSGGLRSVQVPSLLMAKFISIAEPNTKANIETCGVLAGKLSQNKFQITHLIIPKQSGTADSCTTTGEEAIFDYQEKYSLITLGWVSSYFSLLDNASN